MKFPRTLLILVLLNMLSYIFAKKFALKRTETGRSSGMIPLPERWETDKSYRPSYNTNKYSKYNKEHLHSIHSYKEITKDLEKQARERLIFQ
jgi:hypothetical protein